MLRGAFIAPLTRVFCIFWADVVVASVQNIFVHKCRARCHLSEKRNLDRLADLDTLPLLHENLSSILASVFSVERGHAILFGMVSLLERL